MFKVVYDFRRPNWITYGHVLFVEREEDAQAAIAKLEPAAEIVRCKVTPASDAEFAKHEALKAKRERWLANVRSGQRNNRSDL